MSICALSFYFQILFHPTRNISVYRSNIEGDIPIWNKWVLSLLTKQAGLLTKQASGTGL